MKQILAFGDSNTWGLIPGTGERYPEHIRWTGILRKAVAKRGYTVLEDGVCGRTTVFRDPFRSGRKGVDSLAQYKTENLSAAILMLGTNDCKAVFRASPEQIGSGLEQCLDQLYGKAQYILRRAFGDHDGILLPRDSQKERSLRCNDFCLI